MIKLGSLCTKNANKVPDNRIVKCGSSQDVRVHGIGCCHYPSLEAEAICL